MGEDQFILTAVHKTHRTRQSAHLAILHLQNRIGKDRLKTGQIIF